MVWTLDDADVVWVACPNACKGFRGSIAQLELFGEDGVPQNMRGGDAEDAGCPTTTKNESDALPF